MKTVVNHFFVLVVFTAKIYGVGMFNNARDVLEALGGHQAVADALGMDWRKVHNWKTTGRRIPAEMWPRVAAIPGAKKLGITVNLLASLPYNPPY